MDDQTRALQPADTVTEPVPNQFGLLRSRRFLPLFLVQFFGAFNDNVFRRCPVRGSVPKAKAQGAVEATDAQRDRHVSWSPAVSGASVSVQSRA